ncbi:uncharacterized protein LOC116212204 [Punica granatum]|uniref:Uncharacterized protein LOC116212204 n=1 Tax=Punica granatum TaxID=22663 RepID=A0A6P8E7Y9_PUNGR|nr:uncharacterized protein LOC116212204 [Punica granatum]
MAPKDGEAIPRSSTGHCEVVTRVPETENHVQAVLCTSPPYWSLLGYEETNTVKASPDIWGKFIKKNENYETFRSKGCKHYKLLCELFSSSTATCAFRISSTDPPRTAKRCGKQQVNLEEWSDESDDPWSDESDDPVHVVEEPIISESRRGVHERQSSRSSQLQECMELFKASFESRSESVSNKERHSIEAAMADLNELKSTVSMKEYLAGSLALKEETMRQVFMCYPEDARRAWLQTLIPN